MNIFKQLVLQTSIVTTDRDAFGRKISNSYHLLSRQLRPNEMIRTEDMLILLKNNIKYINKLINRDNYKGVVEIYSMEYLNVELKEKRDKAIEAKALAKKL